MGPPHKADYRSFLGVLIQGDCVFCKTIWGEIMKKVKIVVLVFAHAIMCSPLFLIEFKKKGNVIKLSQFEVESGRNKLPPKRSNRQVEDQKKKKKSQPKSH